MSEDSKVDELRSKISKMVEGITTGYHGEDGIDYIMELIKAYEAIEQAEGVGTKNDYKVEVSKI